MHRFLSKPSHPERAPSTSVHTHTRTRTHTHTHTRTRTHTHTLRAPSLRLPLCSAPTMLCPRTSAPPCEPGYITTLLLAFPCLLQCSMAPIDDASRFSLAPTPLGHDVFSCSACLHYSPPHPFPPIHNTNTARTRALKVTRAHDTHTTRTTRRL